MCNFFSLSKCQTNKSENMSRHRCLFLSCLFHTFDEFMSHYSSSGTLERCGFKDCRREAVNSAKPTFLSASSDAASLCLTPHPALTCRLQTPSAAPFDVKFARLYSRVNHTHLERAAWNSIQWVCWPVLSEDSEGD